MLRKSNEKILLSRSSVLAQGTQWTQSGVLLIDVRRKMHEHFEMSFFSRGGTEARRPLQRHCIAPPAQCNLRTGAYTLTILAWQTLEDSTLRLPWQPAWNDAGARMKTQRTAPATSLYGASGAVQSPYQGVYVDNPCLANPRRFHAPGASTLHGMTLECEDTAHRPLQRHCMAPTAQCNLRTGMQ